MDWVGSDSAIGSTDECKGTDDSVIEKEEGRGGSFGLEGGVGIGFGIDVEIGLEIGFGRGGSGVEGEESDSREGGIRGGKVSDISPDPKFESVNGENYKECIIE